LHQWNETVATRADLTDLVVVGGGPSGLAVAINARLAGLDVAVFERRRPPVDVACGEGLMPEGVAALDRLGVGLGLDRARPFRGIRFLGDGGSAAGTFPARHGLGIRRTTLHQALAERATTLGAELRWDVKVTGLTASGVITETGPVSARVVVGADGRMSAVRRWAGLDGRPSRRKRFGIRRHYCVEPWTDLVEVHWADGAEAYVTPVGPRTVGVALLWSGEPAHFDRLLARFEQLRDRLDRASVTSDDRGAGPLEQRAKGVLKGRVALVGDAAGYLDAISGEGLGLGLRQAEALVGAVVNDDLAAYPGAHRRISRHPLRMTRLLLLLSDHPRLRRRVLARLAENPGLMTRFLALKTAPGGPAVMGRGGLAGLAWASVVGGRHE
jgi:flavin-dependent dehydrogenase